MKKALLLMVAIIVSLCVSALIVFAQVDSTMITKNFWQTINYMDILKIVGIIFGAISGGGVTFVSILFAIMRGMPNEWVDTWGDKWGVFLTKIGRQKLIEANVDTAETTYIRFNRATEKAMRRLNPDLPEK